MVRTIIAALLAPAFSAAPIALLDIFRSDVMPPVAAYFVYSYVISLVPASVAVVILKRLRYLRLWHFAIAGFAVAVLCTSILLGVTSLITTSLGAWVSYLLDYWELIVIGPIAGSGVWLVSESKLLRDSSRTA